MSDRLPPSVQSKLDVALGDLTKMDNGDRRPRGGGRFRGDGKRFSPRSSAPKPYSRPPPSSFGGGPSARVYVGNLQWTTSWQDLKDHMRSAGEVVHADVFIDDSGRSKGCGIVEYSSPGEAQNAIATLNDSVLPNTERPIFVREDREDRNSKRRDEGTYSHQRRSQAPLNTDSSAGPLQIFIGNLPYNTSWQDLKDAFRHCGTILRADILMDSTGRSKGSGVVLFERYVDAQNAIRQFDGALFQGRPISVREDKFA